MKINENNILQTRDSLVKNWIINSNKYQQNNEILLLCCKDKKQFDLQSEIEKKYDNNQAVYIDKINQFSIEKLRENEDKNIILISYSEIDFFWFNKFLNEKYVILFHETNNLNELNNLFLNTTPHIYEVNKFNRHLLYIEKKDPFEILQNISIIEDLINVFISKNKNTTCKFNSGSIHQTLFRGKREIDINRIHDDITYFKATFILTSRLAIFIYKLCLLNPNISDRDIGIEFASRFGKSKLCNKKQFNISNTKGYITKRFMYQNEYNIRMQIAMNLLQQECNINVVSNATGIDITTLQNVMNSSL